MPLCLANHLLLCSSRFNSPLLHST
uniref:Uncharacterized protein n=1 Tax=Arundo donax TaxID=35708 RepID=A0A0A9R579_ARUDO